MQIPLNYNDIIITICHTQLTITLGKISFYQERFSDEIKDFKSTPKKGFLFINVTVTMKTLRLFLYHYGLQFSNYKEKR